MLDGWGERIKMARRKASLQQKDLAKSMSVSVGTVSRWERGVSVPSNAEINFMASQMHVSPEWITEGQDTWYTVPNLPEGQHGRTGLVMLHSPTQILAEAVKALSPDPETAVSPIRKTVEDMLLGQLGAVPQMIRSLPDDVLAALTDEVLAAMSKARRASRG